MIVDPYTGSIDSALYRFVRRSDGEIIALEDAFGALARLDGHPDPIDLLADLVANPRTVTFEWLTITPVL